MNTVLLLDKSDGWKSTVSLILYYCLPFQSLLFYILEIYNFSTKYLYHYKSKPLFASTFEGCFQVGQEAVSLWHNSAKAVQACSKQIV